MDQNISYVILNSITEGIYAIDRNGICVYCNSSSWKILNYDCAQDFLGKNMHKLIHYAYADGKPYPSHQCKMFNAYRHGIEIFANDEVFWTSDGKPISVSYCCYPQFNNGKLTGIVVTFSDLSKEKNQQKKLEVSEAKYKNIFKNVNAGIIYVDSQGITISANKAFQDMVQYSLAELQQINFKEIVVKEDWEKELIFRYELYQGIREDYNMEKRYIRKDGKIIWVNASVSSFLDSSTADFNYVTVVNDITDKKEYELQLIESNAVKDKFFSIIAHDLRNPIGSIKMLSGLIKEELRLNDVPAVSELSDFLFTQVNHTNNLLNNLLDWSRAQSKNIAFNPQSLSIASIFEERISSNSILARTKRISLDFNAAPNLMVSADLNMLNTVLRNLITNAIKFSYENSKIVLTAKERTNDILITVKDQGKGMTPAILEKLFLSDSKITTPGTHNEMGTGMGVLLCKEFVTAHGGEIWAESVIGIGTEFLFTLPKTV